MEKKQITISKNLYTWIAILLLIFVYPVGFVFVLALTDWPKKWKVLAAAPIILLAVTFILNLIMQWMKSYYGM